MSDPAFTIYGSTDQDVADSVAIYLANDEAPAELALFGNSWKREQRRLKRHQANADATVPDVLDFIRSIDPDEAIDRDELEQRCVAHCKQRARAKSGVVGFVLSPFWIGIVIRIALLVFRIWLNGGLSAWTKAEQQRAMSA